MFGSIVDGTMRENELAAIARHVWETIPEHRPFVALDAFVVMPDHIHAVIRLCGNDGAGGPTLGNVVGAFKAAVARGVNLRRNTPGAAVWQRGYHEHIVRDEDDLRRVREYVVTNPLRR